MKIEKFDGEYSFLSNFYPATITYNDIQFSSVEIAYQASKSIDKDVQTQFQNITSVEAKKKGKKIELRSDWDQVKLSIMEDLVRQKFQHSELKELLLSTKDAELIEGNYWRDTFWGVCNGVGENHLGKILMKIREELKTKPISVILSRAQIGRSPGLDTTVKSATGIGAYFKPTWDMVMGHKNGIVSDSEYTEKYTQILDRVTREQWRELYNLGLRNNSHLTLLCYCRDGKFCHTYLMIEYTIAKYPKAFSK